MPSLNRLMKAFIFLSLFWLISGSATANLPEAIVGLMAIQSEHWPAEYKLSISIPDGHHAYLDKGIENIYLPIVVDPKQALSGSGLTLNILQKPTGVYDEAVKATILKGTGVYTLAIGQIFGKTTDNPPTSLQVNYQLCNEAHHVCFRPQSAHVNLSLPVVAQHDSETSLSLTDRLLALFKDNKNNTLVIFFLMLMAGILSVATPCVYPMLPITSMFIVNRAGGVAKQEKLHAFAYLVGIIGTYLMLGLLAGMTGGAFNSFMQSAWVNLGFGLFFAFFAISLLGFYELSFMQNEVHSLDQQSACISGLTGTWMMGSVAGLVISPCVGPIVFALLLQVADNIADKAAALAALNQSLSFWGRFQIATEGSLMMAGFGLGVGLPFFLVSVVKFKKLPKAGYWMNKIKYAFGMMILYFAYLYFQKGMGVLGISPQTTLTLAIGLVAIWIAVIHCNVFTLLPANVSPNQKMIHFCGVLAMILGGWLMVAGLSQTPIMSQASANNPGNTEQVTSTKSSVEQEAGISWYRNFASAQQLAKQTGKPLFVDFYASWCANCVAFKAEAANNPMLNQAIREHAVAVRLVDKEPEFEEFKENPEHRQLKIGLPYFAILSAEGKLLWSSTDYTATDKMAAILLNTGQTSAF